MNFNEEEVRECYQFLSHKNYTELRFLDPQKKLSPVKLFPQTEDEFVDYCKQYNGKYNLYVGINERNLKGTEGKDVISVKTIVIDIDAVKVPGYNKEPATEQELKKAEEICDSILYGIKKVNQPLPIKINSGNGYQLWFAIPEIFISDDNRIEIQDKLQKFQDIIKVKYDKNGAIDKIGDLPRIIKVWGTYNIKGNQHEGRLHRLCKVIGDSKRIENKILMKEIIDLKEDEEEFIIIKPIKELEKENIPKPISYLLYEYKHNKPEGWMRIVEVLSSFFRGIGLNKDNSLNHLITWTRGLEYRELNEEHELKEINERIYDNEIMCPNFDKLIKKEDGYPFFGLKRKFQNIDLGNDWEKYKNPVVYYKVKNEKKESEGNIKLQLLNHLRSKEFSEASELLTKHVLDNMYLYTTKEDVKNEIWVYKEGIYVPNGRSEIKEFLRKELGEVYSAWHYNQAIAKVEADTMIDSKEFFKMRDKYKFPVMNGILNIKTRELEDFDPKQIFFSKAPVKYDPEKKCLKIEGFLKDVLAHEEDIKVFYEIGGFGLLKEYTYEKAFMFVGGGRNGKGKTIELLKRVFGIENCSSLGLHALKEDSFRISELFGKLLNLAGDLSSSDLKKTGVFKALTGRDLVSGKRKFLPDIVFENFSKFIFACNELPMVYDLSKGFWDRWLVLDFPYYFADKERFDLTDEKDKTNWKIRDPNIISKISTEDELSGLLNEFLNGLDRLFDSNKFSSTKGSDEIKNNWIRKANSFVAFCLDCIEDEIEGKIFKKDMRKKYNQYCKKHKLAGKSDVVIKITLQEMFGTIEGQTSGMGVWDRYWEGIKWK